MLQVNCTGTAEGPDVLSCGDQAGHWGSGRQRTCYSRPSPPAHTRGAVRPSRAWEGWPGLQPQAPKLDRKGHFLSPRAPPRCVAVTGLAQALHTEVAHCLLCSSSEQWGPMHL